MGLDTSIILLVLSSSVIPLLILLLHLLSNHSLILVDEFIVLSISVSCDGRSDSVLRVILAEAILLSTSSKVMVIPAKVKSSLVLLVHIAGSLIVLMLLLFLLIGKQTATDLLASV